MFQIVRKIEVILAQQAFLRCDPIDRGDWQNSNDPRGFSDSEKSHSGRAGFGCFRHLRIAIAWGPCILARLTFCRALQATAQGVRLASQCLLI